MKLKFKTTQMIRVLFLKYSQKKISNLNDEIQSDDQFNRFICRFFGVNLEQFKTGMTKIKMINLNTQINKKLEYLLKI